MKYMYLEISGMVCASCSGEIKTALEALPGVGEVVVDYYEGNAIVPYDPRLQNQLEVFEVIGELGYHTMSKAFLSPETDSSQGSGKNVPPSENRR